MKENQVLVLWFAVFVGLLVLTPAYFTDHNGDIDELGLFNPSYMVARYGALTYPVHGYFDAPVIVHPPIHTGTIGLLMRAGLPWYYAEATPAAFFLLLAIVLAAILPLPAVFRVGLMFPIAVLSLGGLYTTHWEAAWGLLYGTRPEGHVFGAWWCGLLLLENGRLRNWRRSWLVAGAFLMAWAAGVHYFAWGALISVLVYVLLVVLDLGRKRAVVPATALLSGACLFGIPYLAGYVIPNWALIIQYVRDENGLAGPLPSLKAHFAWYRTFATYYFTWPLAAAFATHIPLLIWSTAILMRLREMRSLALAALPLPAVVFLLAAHKQFSYLIPEFAIYLAAVFIGSILAVNWLLARYKMTRAQELLPRFAAVVTALYLIFPCDIVQGAFVSNHPTVQEGEIARAAARSILGPHAKVASRIALWYASGGAWWHDVRLDLLADAPSYPDPLRYFASFDTAAEHWQSSEASEGGAPTLTSLYSAGTLKLRGFYFGETNPELRFVLLAPERPPKMVGYFMQRSKLSRFDEQSAGDYELRASVCTGAPGDAFNQLHKSGVSFAMLAHPDRSVIVHLVAKHGDPAPLPWLTSCKAMSTVRGTVAAADQSTLADSLRRDDPPIHFAAALDDLPGYQEIGVPPALKPSADGVRLDHVLKAPAPKPVTTPAGSGSFAINIPAEHGDAVSVPCRVVLRLRVLHGRIGLIVWSEEGGPSERALAYLGKTAEPVEISLAVSRLRKKGYVTVFNGNGTPSQVEVLGAAVVVDHDVYERNQSALAALR
jgi:hypothetical protein